MSALTLCVVTATTNLERSAACRASWKVGTTADTLQVFYTHNGGEYGPYLGTVPAFREVIDHVLDQEPEHYDLIACLHDDLEIRDPHWVDRVCGYFAANPAMGLAGFGGATGLGDSDLYQTPYRPEQLARKGFRSNLVDAEVHGIRSLLSERVACLDGFSQIGRREFWEGRVASHTWKNGEAVNILTDPTTDRRRPWTQLEQLGFVHHAYDGALGCLAARHGWETWYLPIACKHWGGQTAVGDPGYQQWAKTQVSEGDHGFWKEAHRIWYDNFRDVLPLRV